MDFISNTVEYVGGVISGAVLSAMTLPVSLASTAVGAALTPFEAVYNFFGGDTTSLVMTPSELTLTAGISSLEMAALPFRGAKASDLWQGKVSPLFGENVGLG